MPVQLNHHIVHARDNTASALWLADMLGVESPKPFGPFMVVDLANDVSLDFIEHGPGDIASEHYAFLVSEDEFDEIFGRIKDQGLDYWADPHAHRPGEINHNDGGRGLYWHSPDGHWLEIITRPYGTGG